MTILKGVQKTDYSTNKLERYKTGGGTFVPVSTETSLKIIALIGNRVEPLCNDDDCDAGYHGDIDPVISTSSGEILPPAPTAELQKDSHSQSNAIREEEHLDPGRSELGRPSTSKWRRDEVARCRKNIADLAESSASLY
ncbi:uncharacterized protein [Anabrus simplex]|uniref:uncharacterized protein n=1 Tax=Anabrus simplex TaxID=316456 RepID=UPI0034DDA24A